MFKFSKKSEERLNTCDTKLINIMNEVIKIMDISILCGHRDENEQNTAYNQGRSKVRFPNSKHNFFPSKAIDIAPYPIDFNDLSKFKDMANVVKCIATKMGVKIKWGGDFKNFFDGPHFELED